MHDLSSHSPYGIMIFMVHIVQKEDLVLRKKAEEVPVKEISSPKIQKVIADMKKALVPHEDGVAIAAPQIGVLLRIFVVSGKVFDIEALKDDDEESAPSKKKRHKDLVFINPHITKTSKQKVWMTEGCLSVRWLYGDVKRATKTEVRAYDERGKRFTRGASRLLSQVFQHEIDHLDGVLFIDKARHVEELPPEKHDA